MANSLFDLLAQKNFDEPPEMKAIKRFIKETYQEDVEILLRERDIVIITSSAALANTLRLRSNDMRAAAQTKKKISFRIR